MSVPDSATLKRHVGCARLCKYNYRKNDNNAFVLNRKQKKTTYIVIKGSSTIRHWRHNINVSLNNLGVHKGFEGYAIECMEELIDLYSDEAFEYLLQNTDHLILTAHSLGAAALLLLLFDILYHNKLCQKLEHLDIELVFFGMPMVGSELFRTKISTLLRKKKTPQLKVYNYSIQNDYATQSPPLPGYTKVLETIVLDAKILNNFYSNHSIENYIRNLLLKIDEQNHSSP